MWFGTRLLEALKLVFSYCQSSLHLQLKFSMPVMARIILPSGWSLLIGFGWSPCLISFCLSISRAFFEQRWPSPGVNCGYQTLWFYFTWIVRVLSQSVENPVLFCGPEPAVWCLSWHQIFPKSLCGAAAHICHLGAQDTGIFSCGNSGLCGHLSLKQGVACVEGEKPSQILLSILLGFSKGAPLLILTPVPQKDPVGPEDTAEQLEEKEIQSTLDGLL